MRPIIIYGLVESDTQRLRYVGKTCQPLNDRLRLHLKADRGTHRCCWVKSVVNRGAAINVVALEELAPSADWQHAERKWIAHFRSLGVPLVNATDGGEGIHNPSPELRAKLRANRLGKKMPPESVARHKALMTGRKRTPEQRARMSEAAKLRGISSAAREKINQALRGRKLTDEHKARIGKAGKGRQPTERQADAARANLTSQANRALAVSRMKEAKRRLAGTSEGAAAMMANLGDRCAPKLGIAQIADAKRRRDGGSSYSAIGLALGVSAECARKAILGLGGYAAHP